MRLPVAEPNRPSGTEDKRGEHRKLLRMRELAEASGVPAATIKHYLREGLLPEPVKTSRNMAYYPIDFADRIKLVKRLQEDRFMPLKVIKELLDSAGDDGPERLQKMVELEDRILERALRGQESKSLSAAQVKRRFELPDEVLARLEELDVITPSDRNGRRVYGPEDVQIIEAIARMRASGFTESLGFTVYDSLIYKENLERMVREEARVLVERIAGRMDVDEAAELIASGVEPVRDLIAALRAKLLVAELKRRSGRGQTG